MISEKEKTIKITFTGDIMCSKEMNDACRLYDGENGNYDYRQIFDKIKPMLQESNLVIGNLETPVAGERKEYTSSCGSFNTPEAFLYALKDAGINFVTTANNHILDRGIDGLKNTIKALHRNGIENSGTYLSPEQNIEVVNFNDCKIAILAFTYGTNSEINGCFLSENDDYMVNILRQQPQNYDFQIYPINKVRKFSIKLKQKIYNKLNHQYRFPAIDTSPVTSINNPDNKKYEERVLLKIKNAKQVADIVIVCLHSGGQYNSELGEYTKYIVDKIKNAGVDVIVCNHPHCVLPYSYKKTFIAYSLGNFTYTPDEWTLNGVYSNYSILLHTYINIDSKIIENYSFSIIKSVQQKEGYMKPTNIVELYNEPNIFKDAKEVMKRFGYRRNNNLQKEYPISK